MVSVLWLAVRLSVSAELLTTMSRNLTMTRLWLISLPSSLTSTPAGDFQSAISGYVNWDTFGTISGYIGSIGVTPEFGENSTLRNLVEYF